ncbi:MAG: zinc-dependent dehydrogenase [Mahellales bacterium]|jgi:L-iditol 2-dehydrogenase
MLAAIMYGIEDVRIQEVDKPKINDNEILVKVKSAAICGTDVRIITSGRGDIDREHPRILGHELSGIIEKVGKNVSCYSEGMRVAIAPNMGCGICNLCIKGDFHLCSDYKALGINLDGGFAEYVKIPEQAIRQGNIIELPDNVSFEEAAINEALSCAYNGFLRCEIKPGDSVLIIGAGPIGIMHAKLAKMAGASKVIMNDLSKDRLDICKKIDSSFITTNTDNLKEYIMDLTDNEGVDVCITACPSPQAQALSLELVGLNGTINFFGGLPASREQITINSNLIHYKQLKVTGTTRANNFHFRKTLSFISSGILDVKALVTGRYQLKDFNKALDAAKRGDGIKNVIVF